jgi:predicted phosphoribosyltransferase
MRFKDRNEAGELLAMKLAHLAREKPIVFTLPRGGVIVACPIARALGAPLDLVIVRKIGHPHNPEMAVCAVSETGELLCDEEERKRFDAAWLKDAAARGKAEAVKRREHYVGHPSIPAEGRTAIIVDDGVATGLSISLAVREVRKKHPKKLVIAIPVAPSDIADVLEMEADEFVMLQRGAPFLGAIGSYYKDFTQVSDKAAFEAMKKL